MKLLKVVIAFIALVSLQIAAAQWLNVPPPVEARNLMIFTTGVPVVAAGCTTSNHTILYNQYATTGDLESVRFSTGDLIAAQMPFGATTYTITRYVLYATDVNESGTLVGALYADSGNNLGSIISDTSVAISNTAITNNPTWQAVTFDLATPKAGVTGTVWVHFSATTDGRFYSYTTGVASTRSFYAAGYHDNRTIVVDVYGCTQ